MAIYHRLLAQFGGAITAERVISTDEQTLRDAGLSYQKARTIRALAERVDDGLLERVFPASDLTGADDDEKNSGTSLTWHA